MVKIAIKYINNKPYIDNDIERFGKELDKVVSECGYKIITLDDKFKDCASTDFDDDFKFNIAKYNERKAKELPIE